MIVFQAGLRPKSSIILIFFCDYKNKFLLLEKQTSLDHTSFVNVPNYNQIRWTNFILAELLF